MKTKFALIITPFLLLAGFAMAQKPAPAAPAKPADTTPAKAANTDTKVIATQKPSYPLDTCPISHEKLGAMGEPVDMVVDGTLVRLCCNNCKKGLEKDKVAVIKSIDDAVIAQQSVGYPMDKCAICSMKMDKPINHVVGTRLVRLCSDACVKTFDGDAMKSADAMAKLDTAWIASLKSKYTSTKCPTCDAKLDDKTAVDTLYGTRLVRVCCKDCLKDFQAKPEVAIAKLDAEMKKAAPAAAPKPDDKKGGDKKGE